MSENPIVLRSATSDDVPLILSFIKALAEYEKLSREVVANESSLKKTLFGERPWAQVILAELENEAVGFALYFFNYSTFLAKPGLYLEDLFVLPEHRGKQVGKALLQHLARIAVEKDCGRMEWSVLNWNQPAIDFYKSLGAEPMDEWTVNRVTGKALAALAHGNAEISVL